MSGNTYHQAPSAAGTAPAGCPMHQSWSPLDDQYLADPYPIASDLRESHPIFFAESLGHVVVTKMADIETVFLNPDVFASTNVQDPIFALAPEAASVLAAPDFNPVAVINPAATAPMPFNAPWA